MNKLEKSVVIKLADEQIEIRYSAGIPRATIQEAVRELFYDFRDKMFDVNIYESNIPEVEPLEPPVVEISELGQKNANEIFVNDASNPFANHNGEING